MNVSTVVHYVMQSRAFGEFYWSPVRVAIPPDISLMLVGWNVGVVYKFYNSWAKIFIKHDVFEGRSNSAFGKKRTFLSLPMTVRSWLENFLSLLVFAPNIAALTFRRWERGNLGREFKSRRRRCGPWRRWHFDQQRWSRRSGRNPRRWRRQDELMMFSIGVVEQNQGRTFFLLIYIFILMFSDTCNDRRSNHARSHKFW